MVPNENAVQVVAVALEQFHSRYLPYVDEFPMNSNVNIAHQ